MLAPADDGGEGNGDDVGDDDEDPCDPATRLAAKKRHAASLALRLLGVGTASTLLPMPLWLPVLRLLMTVLLSTPEDGGAPTAVDTVQAVALLGRLQQVGLPSPTPHASPLREDADSQIVLFLLHPRSACPSHPHPNLFVTGSVGS